MELIIPKLPKNLNIYLRNYQAETAIFLATNYEKTITYGMKLFKFFHTRNTLKQQKMVALVRNLLFSY